MDREANLPEIVVDLSLSLFLSCFVCAFPGKGLGGLQSGRDAESSQKRCSFLEIGRGTQEFPRLSSNRVRSFAALARRKPRFEYQVLFTACSEVGLSIFVISVIRGLCRGKKLFSSKGPAITRNSAPVYEKGEAANSTIFSLKYDLAILGTERAFASKICIKR